MWKKTNNKKMGGNDTKRFGAEFIAVNDKLSEYKCTTATQHKNVVKSILVYLKCLR